MIKGFNTLLYAKLISDDTSGQDGIAIYEPYKKLAGAIEIKPKLNQNSAELYSENMLVDSDYIVSTVSLTLTVDDDNDDIFCDLIGMIEDGDFGPKTKKAVIELQKKVGSGQDGEFGSGTLTKMVEKMF